MYFTSFERNEFSVHFQLGKCIFRTLRRETEIFIRWFGCNEMPFNVSETNKPNLLWQRLDALRLNAYRPHRSANCCGASWHFLACATAKSERTDEDVERFINDWHKHIHPYN